MGESYEIFKTEKRFRSRNSYISYVNITAFFQNKIVFNCSKTENFTHASVCIPLILYTHDGKTMVYFTIHD